MLSKIRKWFFACVEAHGLGDHEPSDGADYYGTVYTVKPFTGIPGTDDKINDQDKSVSVNTIMRGYSDQDDDCIYIREYKEEDFGEFYRKIPGCSPPLPSIDEADEGRCQITGGRVVPFSDNPDVEHELNLAAFNHRGFKSRFTQGKPLKRSIYSKNTTEASTEFIEIVDIPDLELPDHIPPPPPSSPVQGVSRSESKSTDPGKFGGIRVMFMAPGDYNQPSYKPKRPPRMQEII
ncbi:hypothetical protein [Salmon gill poxvirus]